jgi:murein DD-endopeptidase MepM/ murein hydrolase activator NlpD
MTIVLSFAGGIGVGMIAARLWAEPTRSSVATVAQPGDEVEIAETIDLEPGAYLHGAPLADLTARPSARLQLQASVRPSRAPMVSATTTTAAPEVVVANTTEARLAKAIVAARDATVVDQVVVRRGDTLMDIFQRAAIDRAVAHAAVESLRGVYDPRRLRAGQALQITTSGVAAEASGTRDLVALTLPLSLDHEIRVAREGDGFVAARLDRPQDRRLVRRGGQITDSLYVSAGRAAVPQNVVADLIRLFSWDVDFQRDIRRGDAFETLFEEVSLRDGNDTAVRGGEVLYGRLRLGDRDLEAFRFAPDGDGTPDYFDRDGRSLRKFLLRTPIDGARMSSRFGMRRHPILGYTRMHQGVDFAAPTGTPIYAAGDGKVVVAKRNGGYGLYIKLRHTAEHDTAYGHLSRIAKGISPGRRVRQGQVIGYVGSTGRSTGPHLHYEVVKNGKPINPLSIEQPAKTRLAGAELQRFQGEVARIDHLRMEQVPVAQLASWVVD